MGGEKDVIIVPVKVCWNWPSVVEIDVFCE